MTLPNRSGRSAAHHHGTYVAAMIFLAVLVLVGIAVSILLANSRQTADRDVARPAGVANPA